MSAIDARTKATIPLIGGIVPYTPPVLDPLGTFQKKLPLLEATARAAEAKHIELLRQRDAGEIVGTHASDLLAAAGDAKIAALAAIADARKAAEATAAEIGAPMVFLVKTPTSLERDQINVRLVSLGLTTVTDEQLRASMIETLYEIDWQRELADEKIDSVAYADDMAAFMDGVWQKEGIQGDAFAEWRAQETERLLDVYNGAPPREAEEAPPRLISVRDEARMRLLVDRLMEEPRMRRILGKRLDFSRRNAAIIVQINLRGVEGFGEGTLQFDKFQDVLTEASVNHLRESIVQTYGKAVGDRAWLELVSFIDGLYGLDEFETGNSDSPLEKPLDPTGSIVPSGDISTNDGSSTVSPIEPVLADGSGTIIAKSSDSISECAVLPTSNGPTDGA